MVRRIACSEALPTRTWYKNTPMRRSICPWLCDLVVVITIMGSTSGATPTLYTFSGSGNSYKIRLLQALLGIDIKHEELDFLVC